MLLTSNEVHVWYHDLNVAQHPVVSNPDGILSDEERARRDRFVFPQDRHAFTAAHALVRSALSLYEPTVAAHWRFDTGPYGKPAIVPGQAGHLSLKFNLSDTRDMVAVAVTRGVEIGVDVESVRRPIEAREAAHHWFSPPEIRMLSACAPHDYAVRFIELWTLKEAYIKAIGHGLSHPLNSFGFRWENGSRLTFWPAAEADRWWFVLAGTDDCRLAVAIHRLDRTAPRLAFRAWTDPGNQPRLKVLRTTAVPQD